MHRGRTSFLVAAFPNKVHGNVKNAMPSIEQAASTRQDSAPKLPQELPHGLITPPSAVRERIEQERAKHPPEVFAKHEERLLNEWTIGYTFDSLCLEVVYRPTPK